MNENYFSIIIPCYNKEDGIGRCLQSLISQTYDNFEIIIIDDGSTDDSAKIIKSFMRHKARIRAYFLPENHGRLIARNMGMRMAKNDWICWLDADDEYISTYLEEYNKAISENEDIKIFNSGMLILNKDCDGYRIIEPINEDGVKNVKSGMIGAGSFVFHKDLKWFFPEDVTVPYGKDGSFPERLVARNEKFKEICRMEDGHWQPLGNPWGDDFSYFWYITRGNKTKMINSILYIQHVRA